MDFPASQPVAAFSRDHPGGSRVTNEFSSSDGRFGWHFRCIVRIGELGRDVEHELGVVVQNVVAHLESRNPVAAK